MKSSLRSATYLVLAASLAVVVGCPKKAPKTEDQAAPTPTPAAPKAEPVKPDRDFESKPSPTPAVKSEVLPGSVEEINRRGYLKDVNFDFDKFDVRDDAREILAQNADWLRKNPTIKFRTEGHCDERGTAQYNLALGERRASAVRDYLVSLGVETNRVETVSYGKEKPLVPGHDEDSWAKNRRAHFVVTAR